MTQLNDNRIKKSANAAAAAAALIRSTPVYTPATIIKEPHQHLIQKQEPREEMQPAEEEHIEPDHPHHHEQEMIFQEQELQEQEQEEQQDQEPEEDHEVEEEEDQMHIKEERAEYPENIFEEQVIMIERPEHDPDQDHHEDEQIYVISEETEGYGLNHLEGETGNTLNCPVCFLESYSADEYEAHVRSHYDREVSLWIHLDLDSIKIIFSPLPDEDLSGLQQTIQLKRQRNQAHI